MMAYTLRYSNELRNEQDYFRDLKAVEINEESLELAGDADCEEVGEARSVEV